MTKSFMARFLALAVILPLAGCMAQGPVRYNLERGPTWFSYLSGDDVKAACTAGGGDRVRFVYNALWKEQVRAYELKYTPYGAQIDQWVWGPGALLTLSAEGADIAATRASIGIDQPRLARLEQAMVASDVQGRAPRGEFLRSDNFYWVVASCRQGQFHFNAFQAPDARFAALSFPQALFEADRTGVPVNPSRALDLPPLAGGPSIDPGERPFTVQVGENGLDIARLF